jgi:hypothetical protein
MKVLLLALNGSDAGNALPSARTQRGTPLTSRAIWTLSGI